MQIDPSDRCNVSNSYTGEVNHLVRALEPYSEGVHFIEIETTHMDRGGVGFHLLGVATAQAPQSFPWAEPGDQFWGILLGSGYVMKIHDGQHERVGNLKCSLEIGTVYGMLLDMSKGELSFFINGVSSGVAFSGLAGKRLFPAMGLGARDKNAYIARFDCPIPRT